MGTRVVTSKDGLLEVTAPEGPVAVGRPFTLELRASGGSGTRPPAAYLITTVVFGFSGAGGTPSEKPVACSEPGWTYSVDVDPRWTPPRGCRFEADPHDGSKGGVPAVGASASFVALTAGEHTVTVGFACGMYGFTTVDVPVIARPATSEVVIGTVHAKGAVARTQADEYVEITNTGTVAASLTGWRLNAGDTGQDFVFPAHVLDAGRSVRVYTNEVHPESGGFSFASGRSLWNDAGDVAVLRDASGTTVSTHAYGDKAAVPAAPVGPPPRTVHDRIPAVTVTRAPGGWRHTALFGGWSVEFTDAGISRVAPVGGPAGADPASRWGTVLPEAFWTDVPVAGVVQDPATVSGGPGAPHTYVLVKGEEVALLTEDKLIERTTVAAKWPHVRTWLAGAPLTGLDPVRAGTAPVKYLALSADRYCFFTDTAMVETGLIANKWKFLPEAFKAGFDDVIAVPEARWKFMAVKDDQVVFFTDTGIVDGPRAISAKWPALWAWMRQTG
ncbi:lamin tail domain-containing protein [Streptomyces sp. NPDC094049]|uniref:lamin tail domain-containing protein n=1 Tax=Streptomyces sp. NPDC094049 TaxID=3154987 RepID=UPI003328C9F7